MPVVLAIASLKNFSNKMLEWVYHAGLKPLFDIEWYGILTDNVVSQIGSLRLFLYNFAIIRVVLNSSCNRQISVHGDFYLHH